MAKRAMTRGSTRWKRSRAVCARSKSLRATFGQCLPATHHEAVQLAAALQQHLAFFENAHLRSR
jgi:hypothetical protein